MSSVRSEASVADLLGLEEEVAGLAAAARQDWTKFEGDDGGDADEAKADLTSSTGTTASTAYPDNDADRFTPLPSCLSRPRKTGLSWQRRSLRELLQHDGEQHGLGHRHLHRPAPRRHARPRPALPRPRAQLLPRDAARGCHSGTCPQPLFLSD